MSRNYITLPVYNLLLLGTGGPLDIAKYSESIAVFLKISTIHRTLIAIAFTHRGASIHLHHKQGHKFHQPA
jgi:hypothetical protein